MDKTNKTIHVIKEQEKKSSSTDLNLLVSSTIEGIISEWDIELIVSALMREAELEEEKAREIANITEERVKNSGVKQVSVDTIRCIVNDILFEQGYRTKLKKQQVIGIPTYNLNEIIFNRNAENSNINNNNPEACNLAIAEIIFKKYALDNIFTKELAHAHQTGKVHIHDLGFPVRCYCSSHSIEAIKKYGLDIGIFPTSSSPAKHARTLTGHINTFLASMQAFYAGALGLGFVNILYAPYMENMTYEEIKQEAQYLIFSCSQSAFSRGSQVLFSDFNINLGIPEYLKDVDAIGPGGQYTGKTYGDYEELTQLFAKAMMDVWRTGDKYGRPFPFPKCLSGQEILFVKKKNCESYDVISVKELFNIDFKNYQLPFIDKDTRETKWVDINNIIFRGKEKGIGFSAGYKDLKLTTTYDHHNLVFENGEIIEKESQNLQLNDSVIICKDFHFEQQKQKFNFVDLFYEIGHIDEYMQVRNIDINIEKLTEQFINQGFNEKEIENRILYRKKGNFCELKYRDCFNLREDSYITGSRQKNYKVPVYLELNEDMAEFIGWVVAEGAVSQKTNLGVAQSKKKNRKKYDRIENLALKLFGQCNKYDNTIRIDNQIWRDIFRFIFQCEGNSGTRKIPDFLFHSNDLIKIAFLYSLFEGDGVKKNTRIHYATKSRKLAYGLYWLLKTLGIFSIVKHDKRIVNCFGKDIDYKGYSLEIMGDNQRKFLELLNIRAESKFLQLKDSRRTNRSYDNSIVATILNKDELKRIKGKIQGNRISRDLLPEDIKQKFENIIVLGVKDKTIDEIESYAIEIDHEQHNFVCGNGIITSNCDLHINNDAFTDPKQVELLKYACEIASFNGSPYFVFDRDEVTLSACCRLRTKVEDRSLLKRLDLQRFCGFQNITINLPQASYKAKGNYDRTIKEIDKGMDLAVKAHQYKRRFVQRLMEAGGPLYQVGQPLDILNGEPYINLDQATYIIGIIGLNECIEVLTGKQLHEDKEAFKLGLKIISHMYFRIKELSKETGYKFSLEETPAESASARLAKIDYLNFSAYKKVIKGDHKSGNLFYTNSIHYASDAPISLIDRIRGQSKFHTLIESGAIVHAFVKEQQPDPDAIFSLVKKTWENTKCAQLTVSPEFLFCEDCKSFHRGWEVHDQ